MKSNAGQIESSEYAVDDVRRGSHEKYKIDERNAGVYLTFRNRTFETGNGFDAPKIVTFRR